MAEIARGKQKSLVLRRELLTGAVRKKEVSFDAYTARYKEGRTSLSELLSQEAELFELKIQERSPLPNPLRIHRLPYPAGHTDPSADSVHDRGGLNENHYLEKNYFSYRGPGFRGRFYLLPFRGRDGVGVHAEADRPDSGKDRPARNPEHGNKRFLPWNSGRPQRSESHSPGPRQGYGDSFSGRGQGGIGTEAAALEGVVRVSSKSQSGLSLVEVEFHYGVSVDLAAVDVQNAIARIRSRLPEEIGEPQVLKFSTSNKPVLTMGLRGEDLREVRRLAENVPAPHTPAAPRRGNRRRIRRFSAGNFGGRG